MEKIIIFALLSFITIQGQENSGNTQIDIKVGDVLLIGKPSKQHYQYIHFPKPNFIIKKGGIVNYKKIVGNRVIVTVVNKSREGYTKITLKRVNGSKLLNSIAQVNASLEKALKEEELILIK